MAIIFFLSTCLFVCKESKFFKYLAYIFWHLITIITIPLFILASLFGTVGTILIYFDIILKVSFSEDGLKSLFSDPMQISILDTCINLGGNLKPILMGNSTNSKMVETLGNFISNSTQINKLYNTFSNSTDSRLNIKLQTYYTNLTSDIGMDTKDGKEYAVGALADFSTLTDSTNAKTQQVGCTNPAKDYWSSANYTCPDGYVLNQNPATEVVGNPICLGVRFYKENRIRDRYKQVTGCSNSFNLPDNAAVFANSINQYADQSETKITDIKNNLVRINSKYSNTAVKLKDAFVSVKKLIDPFIQILQDVTGDAGLFELINCRFVPNDVAIVIKAFNLAGKSFVEISASIAALALLNWLLLFYGLILLFRKATSLKQKKGNELGPEPNHESHQPNKLEVN